MARQTITFGDGVDKQTLAIETTLKLKDGREIDFTKSLPMTQGDWLQLERTGVVLMNAGDKKVNLREPQKMLDFVAHFAKKANETVGPMDLLEVPIPRVLKLATYLQHKALEDDSDPN